MAEPLIVFAGICLIGFGLVAFMVFRAVFQEIGCIRGDIKGITQALALMVENQRRIVAALPVDASIRAATQRHLNAQALLRKGQEGGANDPR